MQYLENELTCMQFPCLEGKLRNMSAVTLTKYESQVSESSCDEKG